MTKSRSFLFCCFAGVVKEEPENIFSQQNSLRGVYEHGILMQMNPSADKSTGRSLPDKQKAGLSMNYWVIG